MPKCSKCGVSYDGAGLRFCPNCGQEYSFFDNLPQAFGCLFAILIVGSLGFLAITNRGNLRPPAPPPQQEANVQVVPNKPKPGASTTGARNGVLLLKSRVPILRGVTAWVEIDGKKVANWRVGTTEVRLDVTAGMHHVVVISIYQRNRRTIYDKQVDVTTDATTTVVVG